jgi:cytochrome c oxidase cbb3-type subunit I/II
MWVSGVTQGLMWRATNPDGSLMYPTFVETLMAVMPMYWMRLIGGSLYLTGMIMMGYNLFRTIRGHKPVVTTVSVVVPARTAELPWRDIVFAKPIVLLVVVLALAGVGMVVNLFTSPLFTIAAACVAFAALLAVRSAKQSGAPAWHRILEGRALIFTVFSVIAVLAGGVAELVPALVVKPAEAVSKTDIRPYRALELEGRDIFVREGCYTCHSQMIRPLRFETQRYGAPSTLAESALDHPFQWGSKRTGPDLAREGGKYPNLWHYRHMIDPRAITPGSNMPPYAHLATDKLDLSRTNEKMSALQSIGVPYKSSDIEHARADAQEQGSAIARDLATEGVHVEPDMEIVAIISYLQRLGAKPQPAAPAGAPLAEMPTEKANRGVQ